MTELDVVNVLTVLFFAIVFVLFAVDYIFRIINDNR